MMTGTKNNQLALHKVLQIKRFHNLRNYICDESNYPFLSFLFRFPFVFTSQCYQGNPAYLKVLELESELKDCGRDC